MLSSPDAKELVGAASEYEPPTLAVLGSVVELTNYFCIFDKTLGTPDYALHIPAPITNCSS